MSKKKFHETKVGQFLSKTAPGILGTVGEVLPNNGVLGLVKNLIHKDPALPAEDKEKALKLLEQDGILKSQCRNRECFMRKYGEKLGFKSYFDS